MESAEEAFERVEVENEAGNVEGNAVENQVENQGENQAVYAGENSEEFVASAK